MKQVSVNDLCFILAVIFIALIFIIIGPFVQIWAVNTLFKTAIEYSWLNWFCIMILNSSVGAVSYRGK